MMYVFISQGAWDGGAWEGTIAIVSWFSALVFVRHTQQSKDLPGSRTHRTSSSPEVCGEFAVTRDYGFGDPCLQATLHTCPCVLVSRYHPCHRGFLGWHLGLFFWHLRQSYQVSLLLIIWSDLVNLALYRDVKTESFYNLCSAFHIPQPIQEL